MSDKISVHATEDHSDAAVKNWIPTFQSFDADHLNEKDDLVAKTKDVQRTYPMVASAVRTQRDSMVGPQFRMSCRPDIKGIGWSEYQGTDYCDEVERLWRRDAESIRCWIDAAGKKTFTQIINQSWNMFSAMGEIFCTFEYLKDNKRPFSTAVNMIDPARIRTPERLLDNSRVKSGLLVNKYANSLGAFILNRHPGDYQYDLNRQDKYKYVPRRNKNGRENWALIYDNEHPGQTRGRNQFISALKKVHMLDKFEDTVLNAAVLQSTYAAVLESANPEEAFDGLKGSPSSPLKGARDLIAAKNAFYGDEHALHLRGAKIAHAFPGDKLNFTSPNQPIDTFEAFENAMLRHLARGLDVSYEELSGNYAETNYSGARAGMLHTWMSRNARREHVLGRFASHIATVWLEEKYAVGELGEGTSRQRLAFFRRYREELTRFVWHGPGKDHIDPEKGVKAAKAEMAMGAMTLEEYCNIYKNKDWKEVLQQKARENKFAKSLGVHINDFMRDEALQAGINVKEK